MGKTLEKIADEVITRGKKDKSKHTSHFDDHEQTMGMDHEDQDSTMSHGHNVNYNHTTLYNRGVYPSQSNTGDDDDSSLTPNDSNSVSGDSHGSRL